MDSLAIAILDHIAAPALLVESSQVRFANPAAQYLLGSHIVSQDVRIALRNPAAVTLVSSEGGGRIELDGLSVAGSKWEMACHVLDGGIRLVTLDDISVQASVARAHADFVANASHELRTPLAAILGYVETLGDPKLDADSATRTRFLGTIKREAGRMQSLIEDLMSLSRIEAGKHDAPAGLINLVSLSREASGELSQGSRVAIDTNVENAMIVGDRGQMAQVIRNLIDNAIKYGKPGGAVTVAIEATETGWISLTVRDEGDGIAPEHLSRLTERFYRADAGRSRDAGGTGLGLSIVKHIVERHRGRFDMTSRPGSGTIASIMLKRAED
jgi:two-component system, OmpR family, phosphate regulon sensor histidine kinase PhoR